VESWPPLRELGPGELDAQHDGTAFILADEMEAVLAQIDAQGAMAAEAEDRDMGRAPCVARSPTAYEQAGQKHGRTIPLADIAHDRGS
jgi:hypothetical protein